MIWGESQITVKNMINNTLSIIMTKYSTEKF